MVRTVAPTGVPTRMGSADHPEMDAGSQEARSGDFGSAGASTFAGQQQQLLQQQQQQQQSESWDDDPHADLSTPSRLALRGTGESRSHTASRDETSLAGSTGADERPNLSPQHSHDSPQVSAMESSDSAGWDMSVMERKHIHSDAVSGCVLYLEDEESSILVTSSLDGGLKVHTVALDGTPSSSALPEHAAAAFASPFKFAYSNLMRSPAAATTATLAAPSKLVEYRTHSARDPLASLVSIR